MSAQKKGEVTVTDEEKLATMFTRCTREEKIRFVWQAKEEGLTLEEWVVKHLTAVCDAANTPMPDKK